MNARFRTILEEGVLPPLVALAIAMVAGDLLILMYGQAPGAVWRMLLEGTWGNAYGFGQVLYKATTLTCTGLAVAVSLRAGLFSIGAEGQLAAGGFAAAVAGLAMPAGTPLFVLPLGLFPMFGEPTHAGPTFDRALIRGRFSESPSAGRYPPPCCARLGGPPL